jgi:hypothetical protein
MAAGPLDINFGIRQVTSESAIRASEFEPAPIAPKPVLEGPLDNLIEWQATGAGAYSPNTLRAQKSDGAIFQAFCESQGETYLPADPKTIRAFIEHSVKEGKKPATIRRYAATIGRIHVAAGLLNPCSSEYVRLGLKKWGERPPPGRTRHIPSGGRRSRTLSSPPARAFRPIVRERCCAWRMRPWPAVASSWRSR